LSVVVADASLCYDCWHSNNWSGVLPHQTPAIFSLARIVLLALVITTAFGYSITSANGRALLVSSQEQGPYRIDVSILPGQAVVANTHVSIRVLSLANGDPITEATVTISAIGPEGSSPLGPIPAPNDFTPQFFETDVPFDLPGEWDMTVAVVSGLGDADVVVPMNVKQGGGSINWILMAALAVVIVTVGVWTWDRVIGRKQPGENLEENSG